MDEDGGGSSMNNRHSIIRNPIILVYFVLLKRHSSAGLMDIILCSWNYYMPGTIAFELNSPPGSKVMS